MSNNRKELQVGSGYLDYGARFYLPEIGRWNGVDSFSEKYANVTGYQYGLNNPILNIDMHGDSAWKIINQWNTSFANKFVKELPYYIQKYEVKKDKCTCDDLGLSTIMDFARDNELPFKWVTETKTFDASSNEYSNFETFSHEVMTTSGAPDFQNSKNTISINPKDANTGSILLNARLSDNWAHHVQMILGRSDDGHSLLIKQGNFNNLGRFIGSADPNSIRYLGVQIQTGIYNQKIDAWHNLSSRKTRYNFSSQEKLSYKIFNFDRWNK